jgi:thioredoxin reductase
MTDNKDYDVIIIGGSYAGLSAAMALGRSMRNVLIIDSGHPCNSQTPFSHNFLTQDGRTPYEISTLARQQVEKYKTVKFYRGTASSGSKTSNGYEITTVTNEKFSAKKLIFATGIKDVMPDIKGFKECWGISVIHCPYCHGYEYRKQNTGILSNGAKAYHIASLVSNLTDNITILTNGKSDFTAEQMEKLNKHSIQIMETSISEFEHKSGHIQNVVFSNKTKKAFDAVYGIIPFVQHSDIPVSLGCGLNEQGYIKVDPFQATTIQGVYACGDSTNMMRSVANAVYSGNLAGVAVNGELTKELF